MTDASMQAQIDAVSGGRLAVTVWDALEHNPPPGRFPSIRTMVEADLRGRLPVVGVTLNEAEIGAILEAAVLRPYATAAGGVRCATSAHLVALRKA